MAEQDPENPVGATGDSRALMEDTRRLADDVRQIYDTVRTEQLIGKYYEKNPYAVLATAAGLGYVLGGGLFTPFTRRVLRIGMKALVLPVAAAQIRSLTQGPSALDGHSPQS